LTLYHQQNEKELSTLTETSNRKPRVAKRVEFGEGLLKAYEKFKPFPTVETFRKRVAGTVEIIPEKTKMVDGKEVKIPEQKIVYEKIVGYEDIIEIVASYLDR